MFLSFTQDPYILPFRSGQQVRHLIFCIILRVFSYKMLRHGDRGGERGTWGRGTCLIWAVCGCLMG